MKLVFIKDEWFLTLILFLSKTANLVHLGLRTEISHFPRLMPPLHLPCIIYYSTECSWGLLPGRARLLQAHLCHNRVSAAGTAAFDTLLLEQMGTLKKLQALSGKTQRKPEVKAAARASSFWLLRKIKGSLIGNWHLPQSCFGYRSSQGRGGCNISAGSDAHKDWVDHISVIQSGLSGQVGTTVCKGFQQNFAGGVSQTCSEGETK